METSFTIQVLMKSVPVDLEFFRLHLILFTSSGETGLRLKAHCLDPNISFNLARGSLSELSDLVDKKSHSLSMLVLLGW